MSQKLATQVVGNIGLYYVCYQLSKRGWNVLPTSRNARGIDLVIYDQVGRRRHTIQIKSLSQRSPVPFSKDLKDLVPADFLIICRSVMEEKPEIFITTFDELEGRMHVGEKNGKKSYWLWPKYYEEYKDRWEKIGSGI